MIAIESFENLKNNENIKDKVGRIISEFENNECSIPGTYERCLALIELINAKTILKNYNNPPEAFSIVNTMRVYSKNDDFLFEKMLRVNAICEMNVEMDICEIDILALLEIADAMCGYVENKYGKGTI